MIKRARKLQTRKPDAYPQPPEPMELDERGGITDAKTWFPIWYGLLSMGLIIG
jgi:hypothetical protein